MPPSKKFKTSARGPAAELPGDFAHLSSDQIRFLFHELRVYQVELEMQNEELRQVQSRLEESQRRYYDLYELAPVGYITLSEQGLIQEANLAASVLLGVDRHELPMQPLSRFIHEQGQNALYLDVQITPFGSGPSGAVTGYMVQVQDISARKQAQEAQRVLSRQLIRAHEDERRMISRELHDCVGQDLVTVKIGLDELGHLHPDTCSEILEKIASLSRLTGKAIGEYPLSQFLQCKWRVVSRSCSVSGYAIKDFLP